HALPTPMQLDSDPAIDIGPSTSSLTLANLLETSHAIQKSGAGVLAVNRVRAAGLNITGGTVSVISSGSAGNVSRLANLAIGNGAAFDLNNSDLSVGNATSTA